MKNSFLFALCAVVLVLSSCTTYQYTSRQTSVERQNIIATPTVVDVRADYTKRIEVTSGKHRSAEQAMNECRYLALTQNNIDVVVDPIFKVEFTSRRFRATLVGFAGYYTNQRTQIEELNQLKLFTKEDIEKYLMLKKPEVLKYMNAQGNIITINRDGNK